jgi:hypothetical protein
VLRTIMKMSLPNKMTSDDSPEPPTKRAEGRRLTDAERPTRRLETGAYMRRSA